MTEEKDPLCNLHRKLADYITARGPGFLTYGQIDAHLWPEGAPVSEYGISRRVAVCEARKHVPFTLRNVRGVGYTVEAVE